ncbi:MAG TPA: lipid-A-disaccharide synthase [Desulfobacteraceae bacterium]|nr:lipid-A-disaccharide synthase [Desulfobacteraceae bacterium]HPJ68737.1 lipid-A-disaccharide synthase [Desulfobacteraceae bacterium]
MRPFKFVVIVAGEASADLHASNLVKVMKQWEPGIVFWGIGGKKMEEAGVKLILSSSDMAVVGLTEAFSKFRTLARASKQLKYILKNARPDLLILLDYPGFNIHIAKAAKQFHVPVLYYIAPQVWAWRRGRVKKIARRVNHMAVILPFEEEFFKNSGINVDYVGHPILDCIAQKNTSPQIEQNFPVIGIVPGSRREEIRNLLPVMIRSAEILENHYGGIKCLLPLAPTIDAEFVQSFIDSSNVSINITVCRNSIYDVLSSCDIAMVTSGTATLETAVMGIPMVIVYKVSPISYWLAKKVIKTSFIGLVNLVAGEKVVPELIQYEATPERLAEEVLNILENQGVIDIMKNKMKYVKESLGNAGASEKTAQIAIKMIRQQLKQSG